MRPAAVLLTIVCLAACSSSSSSTSSEQLLVGQDAWRQKQAELDADAIVRGMEQARERAEALARSAQ
jgi:hypothetical protein